MDYTLFDKLSEKYPFLTVCRYAESEYVGIVQNCDSTITTIYDFGALIDPAMKLKFLELGEVWWWESNRSIPINIFLRGEWDIFKPCLRTFNNKSLEVLIGPTTSLSQLSASKRKRKSITLVRKMD
jgi:hypothetical protein